MLVQSDRRRQNLVDALVSALDQKGRVERLSLFSFSRSTSCHFLSSVLIQVVEGQFLSVRSTAKLIKSEGKSKTSWRLRDEIRGASCIEEAHRNVAMEVDGESLETALSHSIRIALSV